MLKSITFAGTTNPKNKEDRHYKAYGIHRDYVGEAERYVASAKKVGIENSLYYTIDDLKKSEEYKKNPKTFADPPYHWAFKPLFIYHTLNEMDYGEYVLYADSNYVFRKYPKRLMEIAFRHDIYTYDHSPTYYPNACWTYRDTFVRMGCDEEKYWKAPQYHADVLCIIKNSFTMAFVEEWKNFTCDYDTIAVNNLKNFDCYNDHRDDQSVFSILTVKHQIQAHGHPADILWEEKGLDLNGRLFKNAIL
jgi:hypothetical protein